MLMLLGSGELPQFPSGTEPWINYPVSEYWYAGDFYVTGDYVINKTIKILRDFTVSGNVTVSSPSGSSGSILSINGKTSIGGNLKNFGGLQFPHTPLNAREAKANQSVDRL